MPTVLKVKLYDWPGAKEGLTRTPLSTRIMCGTVSLLVQVTLVPLRITGLDGEKAKLSIKTETGPFSGCTEADGLTDAFGVGEGEGETKTDGLAVGELVCSAVLLPPGQIFQMAIKAAITTTKAISAFFISFLIIKKV